MSNVVCGRLVAINETLLQVEIDPEQELTMLAGQTVAVALMVDQERKPPLTFEKRARALWESDFFRCADVWKAVGSDAAYQSWCRQKPSAHSGREGNVMDPIEFAHVRRIKRGAGTGIKPPYFGVPLLRSEHKYQHQHGETALRPREWFEAQALAYVHLWAWETLKAELGHFSWRQVPPSTLHDWAVKHGVESRLPDEYRLAPSSMKESNAGAESELSELLVHE